MDLSRQSDLVKNQGYYGEIVIIGAGAIGSNAANVLARMGFRIKLIDPQEVAEENFAPGSFVAKEGRPKVLAVRQLLVQQGVPAQNITACHREATGADVTEDSIVIIGTDSMESRKEIWTGRSGRPALYIDARIGGKTVTVISLTKDQQASGYTNGLDGESEELPCGSKATAYTGGFAANTIAMIVAQFVQKLQFPSFVYFDADNMLAQFFGKN